MTVKYCSGAPIAARWQIHVGPLAGDAGSLKATDVTGANLFFGLLVLLLLQICLFFCYERDFMKSLSRENQADIIEAFNSTSRYLDDLLNIDNIYFDQMVDRIYPTEL